VQTKIIPQIVHLVKYIHTVTDACIYALYNMHVLNIVFFLCNNNNEGPIVWNCRILSIVCFVLRKLLSFCFSSIALEQLLSPDCCLPYPQVLAAGILLAWETRQDSQQVSERHCSWVHYCFVFCWFSFKGWY